MLHELEITCPDVTFLTMVTLRAQLCLKRIYVTLHIELIYF